MEKSYLKDLLEGGYGDIQKKHKDLAKIIKGRLPELDTIQAIIDYCSEYPKYDNFTFRDFDKALAISTE